ncbi:MAG TPA: adenosine kinase [Bacteroidales bacterium]|nr:adenosine kinase [Bacteroidales bacterium]
MKILGMGNALVDIMTQLNDDIILDKFNLPKGSMTLVDRELSNYIHIETAGLSKTKASGGSAANTIHGLAHLGSDVSFIGKIGRDDMGRFFKRDMEINNVKPILYSSITDTGRAVALVSQDSERTFATYLGAAVELSEEDITSDIFTDYDVFYIEGYLINNLPLINKALRLAHGKGLKTCIDLASFNIVEQYKEALHAEIRDNVDIIFANEEEARAFTGLEPEDALDVLCGMCEIAIVKTGSKGSLIGRGQERIAVPALRVNSIDTTGAGDLYAAGFLYGLSRNQPLKTCGETGTILAANVIEVIGAKMKESTWENIRREINLLNKK